MEYGIEYQRGWQALAGWLINWFRLELTIEQYGDVEELKEAIRRKGMSEADQHGRPFLSLDPGVCSGKPTIGFSRLYVQVVARTWWAGVTEPVIYINWPSCKGRADLLLACWWMARYGTRTWRKRWGAWLQATEGELWAGNYSVDLPPQKGDGRCLKQTT